MVYRTFRHFDAASQAGRYGCISGPISTHEQSAMDLETRAITDRVTKSKLLLYLVKHVINSFNRLSEKS